MSAYTDALRNLAEYLDAHPEWDGELFHILGSELNVHLKEPHLVRRFIRQVGGQWKSHRHTGTYFWISAKNVLGFEQVTIFIDYPKGEA